MPLTRLVFSPATVNKRWYGYFKHPLQVFINGDFSSDLLKFPPTYYIQNLSQWNIVSHFDGMSKQIRSVRDEDDQQEKFILDNMFLHSFKLNIECKNTVISEILNKMKKLNPKTGLYLPTKIGLVSSLCDYRVILKVLDLFPNHISWSDFHLLFDNSAEFCRLAVQKNGSALAFIPKHQRTEVLCEEAVQACGEMLREVPETLRTEELCKLAVIQRGLAIYYVPPHLRTEELCTLAVEQNGYALDGVPQHLRTEELCKIALYRNGGALEYIPEYLKTGEMCKLALQQGNGVISLKHVPQRLLNEELSTIALKTEELCTIAVRNFYGALQYIPQNVMTEEMCKIAVEQNGYALSLVPEEMKTEEICRLAVQQQAVALGLLPDPPNTNQENRYGDSSLDFNF